MNLFGYVLNNPVNLVDPFGLNKTNSTSMLIDFKKEFPALFNDPSITSIFMLMPGAPPKDIMDLLLSEAAIDIVEPVCKGELLNIVIEIVAKKLAPKLIGSPFHMIWELYHIHTVAKEASDNLKEDNKHYEVPKNPFYDNDNKKYPLPFIMN